MGWCPSGRLFEAAACGAAISPTTGTGSTASSSPGSEILMRERPADVLTRARARAIASLRAIGRGGARASAGGTYVRAPRDGARSAARAARHAPAAELDGGGLTCGASCPLPAAAAASSRWPSPRSCCRSEAGCEGGLERPCAVSEYLVERMIAGGADKICFVISPGKSDIMAYFGASYGERRHRLCGAAAAGGLVRRDFPRDAADRAPTRACWSACPIPSGFPRTRFSRTARRRLSFLLFPVERPAAVRRRGDRRDGAGAGDPGQAAATPRSTGSGARSRCRAPSCTSCSALWRERATAATNIIGTLVNAYLPRGGEASGVKAGDAYVDVGTFNGYRAAIVAPAAKPLRGGRPAGPPVAPADGCSAAAMTRWMPIARCRDEIPAPRRGARAVVPQYRARRRRDGARPFPRRLSRGQMAALRARDPGRPQRARPCSTSAATPASTRSR